MRAQPLLIRKELSDSKVALFNGTRSAANRLDEKFSVYVVEKTLFIIISPHPIILPSPLYNCITFFVSSFLVALPVLEDRPVQ